MGTLKELLYEGPRTSKGNADEAASLVLNTPELLQEVLPLVYSENAALVARAAHVLMQISKKKPELLFPHKDELLSKIAARENWEIREQIVKIVPTLPLDGSDIPPLFELFQNYLEDSHAFVRAYAIEGLTNLCDIDNSLAPHVRQIITQQMSFDKASIRARGRKMLKKLDKFR